MKTDLQLAAAIALLGGTAWVAFLGLRAGWYALLAHRAGDEWGRDKQIVLSGLSLFACIALSLCAAYLTRTPVVVGGLTPSTCVVGQVFVSNDDGQVFVCQKQNTWTVQPDIQPSGATR